VVLSDFRAGTARSAGDCRPVSPSVNRIETIEISICALSDVFPERSGPRTNLKVVVDLVGSFLFAVLYGSIM